MRNGALLIICNDGVQQGKAAKVSGDTQVTRNKDEGKCGGSDKVKE